MAASSHLVHPIHPSASHAFHGLPFDHWDQRDLEFLHNDVAPAIDWQGEMTHS